MWIKTIEINNIKSFANSGLIELSPGINILIGANNSGKSTILQSALILQGFESRNPRINETNAFIQIRLANIDKSPHIKQTYHLPSEINEGLAVFEKTNGSNQNGRFHFEKKPGNNNFVSFPNTKPQNFIHTFLSQRKTIEFLEAVNETNVDNVPFDLRLLFPKIDDLSDPYHPNHAEFDKIVHDILGFPISSFKSSGGKKAGLRIDQDLRISVNEMGQGVIQILGFLIDLCQAENKLFLIEELENDLHPEALKKLLNVIISKAEKNQFIITTHSHIILKYLGAIKNSKVFNIMMSLDENKIPISTIQLVLPEDSSTRKKILEKLGYELLDFDLYAGWLILEESSAERIIRDHLVRWFVPNLFGKLKTIAAQGAQDIGPRFIEFERLFTFVHLESTYTGKAWVIADGDESGKKAIKNLQERYSSWDSSHFKTFNKENFENYYPDEFQEEVKRVLEISDKKEKRKEKENLLNKVLKWIKEDDGRAKLEFEKTCEEIIAILKEIDSKI